MKIGILALQGDVREHAQMLEKCGAEVVWIKNISQLSGIQGLILPGGESTAIGKLMVRYGFIEAIKEFHSRGNPIYGTCAGLILIARVINNSQQPSIGLMDINVRRNAFGRQIDSCEAYLDIPALGSQNFKAVFIRAPWIEKAGSGVEVLAYYEGHPVMAREGNLLATAFHPELTDDPRVHEYFLNML